MVMMNESQKACTHWFVPVDKASVLFSRYSIVVLMTSNIDFEFTPFLKCGSDSSWNSEGEYWLICYDRFSMCIVERRL